MGSSAEPSAPGASVRLIRQAGGQRVDGVVAAQWRREGGNIHSVEEAGVRFAREEPRAAEDPHEKLTVGREPVDLCVGQALGERKRGFLACRCERDDLGEHRVVVDADLGTVGNDRVSRRTSIGHPEAMQRPRRRAGSRWRDPRRRGGPRRHGRSSSARTHRVAAARPSATRIWHTNQVEAGDHLGDRVLDLEARIHLEEEERSPLASMNSTVPAP